MVDMIPNKFSLTVIEECSTLMKICFAVVIKYRFVDSNSFRHDQSNTGTVQTCLGMRLLEHGFYSILCLFR
jgi:hypothetical protein